MEKMEIKINFLEKLIEKGGGYWIVARETFRRKDLEYTRGEDDIIFVKIPYYQTNDTKLGDLTISTVEKILAMTIDGNIFLYPSYPPFQDGVSLGQLRDGFRCEELTDEIFAELKKLGKKNIYEYEKKYLELTSSGSQE